MILNDIDKGRITPRVQPKVCVVSIPQTILVFEVTQFISLLMLLKIEEAIWYLIRMPSLSTLAFNKRAQFPEEFKRSQHNFMLKASLRVEMDLKPKPPRSRGLHTLAQATITSLVLLISPYQMKFLMPLFNSLIRYMGQE